MPLVSRRFAGNEQLEAAARNAPALRVGAAGKGVGLLQAALLDLGFPMPVSTGHGAKRADGVYGYETAKTVRAFQGRENLAADGVAGRDTLTRLDQICAAGEATRRAVAAAQRAMNLWT